MVALLLRSALAAIASRARCLSLTRCCDHCCGAANCSLTLAPRRFAIKTHPCIECIIAGTGTSAGERQQHFRADFVTRCIRCVPVSAVQTHNPDRFTAGRLTRSHQPSAPDQPRVLAADPGIMPAVVHLRTERLGCGLHPADFWTLVVRCPFMCICRTKNMYMTYSYSRT